MSKPPLRLLSVLTLAYTAACAGCLAAAHANPPATRPSTGPSTQPAATQPSGEYIEYRAQPELGRISITDCAVRGAKAVQHLLDHADELAKQGVFACPDDDRRHVYKRSERMAGRKIDVLIVVEPPPAVDPEDEKKDDKNDKNDKNDEEAVGTQRLVIRVDGRRKVDCSIGTSADGEVWVSQVVIHPEDGTLEIRALGADGEELSLPDAWLSLDDRTLITDDSFFEDGPPDAVPGPMKV